MFITITQYFTLLVLKQVNVVATVIMLMIPTQKYVVKNLNVNVFNLMSRTNETKKYKVARNM